MPYLSLLVSMKLPLSMCSKAVPVRMETAQGTEECGLMKLLTASSPSAVTMTVALTETYFPQRSAGNTRTNPSAVVKEVA